MNTIKTILVPSDLSDFSRTAVRYALELAQWQRSAVILCNVVTVEETPFPQGKEEWVVTRVNAPKMRKILDERAKIVEEFLAKNFADLLEVTTVRREIRVGTPYRVIVQLAVAEAADLIVMSTHGRTGLAHMLMGSVAEKVLRRAPCPVLAVPLPKSARRGIGRRSA